MKTFLGIIIAVVVVIFLCVISNQMENADKEKINTWAVDHSLKVSKIDTHLTTFGTPFFYVNRGHRIYEVDMTNGDKWWVRTSILGADYEKDIK